MTGRLPRVEHTYQNHLMDSTTLRIGGFWREISESIERLGFASEDLEDRRETRDVEDLPDDLVEAADP